MKHPVITTTVALGATLALAAGWTVFTANDNSATEAATYASTHPVVTPTPVETTVTTEVTPDICVQALTDADAAMVLSGEGFGILGDAFDAASQFDADGVNAANRKMSLLNKRLTVALTTYKTSRDACKAGQ